MKLRTRLGRWLSGDGKNIKAMESNIRLLKEQLENEKAEKKEYAERTEKHLSDLAKQVTDLCDKRDALTAENKTLIENLGAVRENLEKSLQAEKALQTQVGTLKAELKDVKSKHTALIKKHRQKEVR